MLTAPRRQLIVHCRITWVEVISAFARRQRNNLTTDVAQVIQTFRLNTQYQVIELDAKLAETGSTSRAILYALMMGYSWHQCYDSTHFRYYAIHLLDLFS